MTADVAVTLQPSYINELSVNIDAKMVKRNSIPDHNERKKKQQLSNMNL